MTNFSRGQPKGKMCDNLQFFVDNPFVHSRFDSTCMSFNTFLRVISLLTSKGHFFALLKRI